MAGAMAMNVLPRDRNLNIGLGGLLMLVGLVVVFWSFSGEQAYERSYFYLAVGGTFIALLGAVLLANSRVVATRRSGAAATTRAGARGAAAPGGPLMELVRMECPGCRAVFEAEGTRPFSTTCPGCGTRGRVA